MTPESIRFLKIDSTTGNLKKRIHASHYDTRNVFLDDQFRAGRRLSIMGTGLKTDIKRGIGKQFGM